MSYLKKVNMDELVKERKAKRLQAKQLIKQSTRPVPKYLNEVLTEKYERKEER